MYFKWSSSQGTKQHCCKNIQTTDRSMHGYFSESQKCSNESSAGTLTTSLVPSMILPHLQLVALALGFPVSLAVSEEQWGGMEDYASASASLSPAQGTWSQVCAGAEVAAWSPVHTNTLLLSSVGATLGYFWHKW